MPWSAIVRSADGYTLTQRGLSLLSLFAPVNQWAEDWAKEMLAAPEHAADGDADEG